MPRALAITSQVFVAAVGKPIAVTVELQDDGILNTAAAGPVSLAIATGPSGAAFVGAPVATMTAGAATFAVQVTKPGIYTFAITARDENVFPGPVGMLVGDAYRFLRGYDAIEYGWASGLTYTKTALVGQAGTTGPTGYTAERSSGSPGSGAALLTTLLGVTAGVRDVTVLALVNAAVNICTVISVNGAQNMIQLTKNGSGVTASTRDLGNSTGASNPAPYTPGTWALWAFRTNGSTESVLVNGAGRQDKFLNNGGRNTNSAESNLTVSIMSTTNTGDALAELGVWHRAMSDAEILAQAQRCGVAP